VDRKFPYLIKALEPISSNSFGIRFDKNTKAQSFLPTFKDWVSR